MCGIFATMTRRNLPTDRRDAALKLLEHRGPDGTGTWTSRDGQWTLGHTRLSIIGLNNGTQPMTSPDGAVHMVVNGEFYGYREIREHLRANGYRFATESDSEIALHLYHERGMQAPALLRGEFAVIIADERQRAMFAIRDRFGVKPLYYAVVNGEVFFASEIKALLALGVPAAWDLEGATGGFGRTHEKTEFAGISTVPPGCYAVARTVVSASIRIGIGRCRPRSRRGQTGAPKRRSSRSFAKRYVSPSGSASSPMSRWPRT
ncbi:hypothetical protein GCM10010533_25360 [Mycolicibacterium pallens]